MKGKSYNVVQELTMISDPILGVKYELKNVLVEQEETTTKSEKKCRHPKSSRQEIGNRILCSVCNQYLKSSNKNT